MTLPVLDVQAVIRGAVEAMAFCHVRGVVHNAIAGSCFLLSTYEAKDWGEALPYLPRVPNAALHGSTKCTNTHQTTTRLSNTLQIAAVTRFSPCFKNVPDVLSCTLAERRAPLGFILIYLLVVEIDFPEGHSAADICRT